MFEDQQIESHKDLLKSRKYFVEARDSRTKTSWSRTEPGPTKLAVRRSWLKFFVKALEHFEAALVKSVRVISSIKGFLSLLD